MSKGRIKRKGGSPYRKGERRRPSALFFIALLIGLVVLAWAGYRFATTPVTPSSPSAPAR